MVRWESRGFKNRMPGSDTNAAAASSVSLTA